MLNGILILWFTLTLLSFLWIVYDLITNTPEAGVMKLAWALVVIYTGPVGLFFYLTSCREPLPMTHEEFIKPLWKQALGSEIHCLAGDATGIIVAAAIIAPFKIGVGLEVVIEYLAGFLFGLFIFQALFMKNMMGGSYLKALTTSIIPEWFSMNLIMAGMIPTMVIWNHFDSIAKDPFTLNFWGKMSLATLIGGIIAYPINHWLVKNKLKHGMTTVRKDSEQSAHSMDNMDMSTKVSNAKIVFAGVISVLGLSAGSLIGAWIL